jgi:hypothetical protein
MANANFNTAWKNDLYPLIDKVFEYKVENYMNILKQVIGEEDDQSIDYRLSVSGGFGEVPDYDGSNLKGMNQKRGFVKIITQAEKAGSIDIQRLYAMSDKSGEAKKAGTKAAGSLNATAYLMMLRLFGNAWNTNAQFLGADGLPWASNAHPIASKGDANGVNIADPDAGTFSNVFTKGLSVSAITEMQTAANRFVTPDGLPCMIDFSNNGLLLVSPELEPKAKELCGPNGKLSLAPTQLPEGNLNNANPIYGLQYVVIGGGNDGFSAKQWGICDKTQITDVAKMVYMQRPTVLKTDLDNPLIARLVPYMVAGLGFGDARPICFSQG